jgi:PAS domain S-box-containing protein
MKDIGSQEELLARIKYLEEELASLKERDNKLATAVENSPATILITNKEGNIEYANSTFAETGYSIEEALGKNPRILQSGMHTSQFYKSLWDQISTGKVWDGEFYNKRKDGSFYWEHARITPLKNDTGEINNYVAIKLDITQQKEYEKQFKTIFDLAPLVIIFYDLNLQLIDCNQQFLNYLSIQNKASVIGKNILDFLPIEERERAQQNLVKAVTGLNYYLFVNGEKRHIEVSTNLVDNEKKEPICAIAIIRDVTQLKKTEQKLKELIATKDKFFSVIANHLKNPFSAIVGFSNILSENNLGETPNDDKIRQTSHIAAVIN